MNLNDGIPMEDKEMVRSQMIDYYSFAFPEFNIKDMLDSEPVIAKDKESKVKLAINVPDIQLDSKPKAEAPSAKPVTPSAPTAAAPIGDKPSGAPSTKLQNPAIAPQPVPQVTKQDIEIVNQKISEIYKILDGYVGVTDLGEFENRVEQFFKSSVDQMDKKLESFKRTVIPQRKQFETDVIHKKDIYNAVCQVLDDLLIPLFDSAPDYNLISFQSTQYFKDGSIANAMVCITATLVNGVYSHVFKVEVPILCGIINAPMYLSKGSKIIPLIKSEIQKELNSFSYMQAPKVDNPLSRDSLYNISPEDLIHREDNQTEYETSNTPYQAHNPGGYPKLNVNVTKNNGDPDYSTGVNNPKFFPKF